ncbi:hypothetical protein DM2_2978 [Halorubrum sp. DM2]|uniref:DUF5789 family protein n=1 Tax=Halorubrum sp. DM2 TaxID=2527867 RepID=UPI0024B79A37|nr:hypothetical protein [Halorubrum sp. DM2]VTT86940.1 hypothetical protein DM2_2978 [Halorubrum sp. DM2]
MGSDNVEHETGERGPGPDVSFGPLKRALREHRYPVTAAELIEQYGAAELETPTATERFGGLLEDCEETQFRDPSDVRGAVLDALGYADASPERPSDDWTSLPR